MSFARHVPAPPLSRFVELLWLYEGHAVSHEKERILPTGTMEIVIALDDDTLRVYDRDDVERATHFRGGLLSGVQTGYNVIDAAGTQTLLGVHFRPGGAFPFLGMPAGELCDATVSLGDLWGAWAGELCERLLEASTTEARFRILERGLLERAFRPLEGHPAVRCAIGHLCDAPGTARIADVAARIGLSSRRLNQVFGDEVGLTPKLFSRVWRFQDALQRIAAGGDVDWMDIAIGCGYFDQPHFIHDFRAFTGLTPTEYLSAATEHLNHVPLKD